jgi:hypothetical protein
VPCISSPKVYISMMTSSVKNIDADEAGLQ